jgi:hypothetical protein
MQASRLGVLEMLYSHRGGPLLQNVAAVVALEELLSVRADNKLRAVVAPLRVYERLGS